MADNQTNITSAEVKQSVSSIYSELINKRRNERDIKIEERRLEKEVRDQAKEDSSNSEEKPLTKKEKRESDLNSWKETIIGLTGDDLDYVSTSKNKKKYKKWIDEDTGGNAILTTKPSKKKKKNFTKEFEPEINMLKAIVADQNRFTADLQKRYQIAAGPNTKDAMPLNKTLVELAAVVNSSRSNSLGVLKEIGNLKKTIADLYMKQVKLDADSNGEGFSNTDVGIMGSNIAASMFSGNVGGGSVIPSNNIASSPVSFGDKPVPSAPQSTGQGDMVFKKFDPDAWDGDGLSSGNTKFEAIPHTVMVEWHRASDKARFKAVRNDTGEELIGCPVPTCTVKAIDPITKVAKDAFDQVYQVEIIE